MKLLVTALLALSLVSAVAAQAASEFVSREFGFSITPPELDPQPATTVQVGIFFLPPSDGFSANVNVQVQPYDDSLAAYDKLSVGQFKEQKWKVLQRELTDDSLAYEYRGKTQGLSLHWYSVARRIEGYVILVTATALESHWDEQEATLKASVDSFQLNE